MATSTQVSTDHYIVIYSGTQDNDRPDVLHVAWYHKAATTGAGEEGDQLWPSGCWDQQVLS